MMNELVIKWLRTHAPAYVKVEFTRMRAELEVARGIIAEVERETASDDYGDLYAAIDNELLTRMQQAIEKK